MKIFSVNKAVCRDAGIRGRSIARALRAVRRGPLGLGRCFARAVIVSAGLFPLAADPLPAQNGGEAAEAPAAEKLAEADVERPAETDAESRRLLDNYLAVTGGREAHSEIRNVVVRGVLEEPGPRKRFKLVETRDGRRRLTLTWKIRGREQKVVRGYDGSTIWRQRILPGKQPADEWEGPDARHFARQRWFLHPFLPPLRGEYVFAYAKRARVGGRSAYLVVGYGPGNHRSWFYFDSETFLLSRWGGLASFGDAEDYLDYRAKRFKWIDGVLWPKRMEQLAEESSFGRIKVEEFSTNESISADLFKLPPDELPVLRQRER